MTKSAQVQIRALDVDDAPELVRLQEMPAYRYGTLRPPYLTVTSARKHLERMGPDDLMLGAFMGGRLCGTAGLHRSQGRRRHAATLGMGVADDLGGRGIGTALLNAIIDAADNWLDIGRIELTVFVDNERAIRLYERHGFEREGVMRAWALRDGRYVDALAMARIREAKR
jgi:putative acetyltransferase